MNKDVFKQVRKAISIVILAAFISTSVKSPAYAQWASVDPMPFMPKPGVMVHLSPEYTPAYLKGIVIHPENALKFDFIIYKGDRALTDEQKREEYTKLTKYFLASLAIPDDDQWVNLSPYEKDRIIKGDFGKTEMGRDLLAQDYMLKQITASLIYPEDNLGRKFWDKVYSEAQKQYGTTEIPVNTFNKVWILPDDALIYEKGNTAYVLRSHLRVMLEEDYLSLQKHSGITSVPASTKNNINAIGSKIVREIVLPELQREVNEDQNFATVRQVYSGMLLATWYKHALKESLLSKIYADKSKVKGVDQDPKTNEEIYQRYLRAYKKGVFNFIKEDVDRYTNEVIPRKYFSGGGEGWDLAALALNEPEFGENGIIKETTDSALLAGNAGNLSNIDLATVATEEQPVKVAFDAQVDHAAASAQQEYVMQMAHQVLEPFATPGFELIDDTTTVFKRKFLALRFKYTLDSLVMYISIRGNLVIREGALHAGFPKIHGLNYAPGTSFNNYFISPIAKVLFNRAVNEVTPDYINAVVNTFVQRVQNAADVAMLVHFADGTQAPLYLVNSILFNFLREQAPSSVITTNVDNLAVQYMASNSTTANQSQVESIIMEGISSQGGFQEPQLKDTDIVYSPDEKEFIINDENRGNEKPFLENAGSLASNTGRIRLQHPNDAAMRTVGKKFVRGVGITGLGIASLLGVEVRAQKITDITTHRPLSHYQNKPVRVERGPFSLDENLVSFQENGERLVVILKGKEEFHAYTMSNGVAYELGIQDVKAEAEDFKHKALKSKISEKDKEIVERVLAKALSEGTANNHDHSMTVPKRIVWTAAAILAASLLTPIQSAAQNLAPAPVIKAQNTVPGRPNVAIENESISQKIKSAGQMPLGISLAPDKDFSGQENGKLVVYYNIHSPNDSHLLLITHVMMIKVLPERALYIKTNGGPYVAYIFYERDGIWKDRPIDKEDEIPDTLKFLGLSLEGLNGLALVNLSNPLGGIDFNSANLNLQIKRDGHGVPLPISQQDLEHINIDGLVPIIIDIRPATSLPIFSELQNTSNSVNT